MRKVLIFGMLMGVLASCGPRRLGCGPGRCEVVKPQKALVKPC
ncbi:hypothetical protein FLJC2902T_08740 [Flavobacterium limnosediminis JC2902]|uniref:Lipoprotein n=1 Tax=Flavobacterium limnosediminis JC2902 TaxID=1341181 RepID=V6SSM9_9FLAO|nr:hypothetical protein [Flavobacterium limnosediminis]ESU29469.1 hypothetical protein FLJC2902T_08740 [Flavobacterium limnosediminis JC2902]